MNAYQMWWDTEGSAMRLHDREDLEEFARRITEVAWENGRNGRELATAIAQRSAAVEALIKELERDKVLKI